MTTEKRTRPAANGTGSRGYTSADAESTVHLGQDDPKARPRCLRCSHPLTAPRSRARGYGRVCWQLTELGHLAIRRDAVGRLLGRVGARVARVDAEVVELASDALTDLVELLDALDTGEGVPA